MSRSTLIRHAKLVGVATVVRGRGYEGAKSTEGLRIDLLERLYGPSLGVVRAPTPAALDKVIANGIACRQGDFGYNLSMAQYSLRNANAARAELKRICGLKRRRPNKEEALYKTAMDALAKCREFQEQYLAVRGTK